MSPREYSQLLYETLENKTDIQQGQIFKRFKDLLTRNKDTHLSSAIEKELAKIQGQKAQDGLTYIVSSSKLSSEQRKELEDAFPEPREFSENPSLLGGVAVRQKDKVYNAALRKRVESLKNLL